MNNARIQSALHNHYSRHLTSYTRTGSSNPAASVILSEMTLADGHPARREGIWRGGGV